MDNEKSILRRSWSVAKDLGTGFLKGAGEVFNQIPNSVIGVGPYGFKPQIPQEKLQTATTPEKIGKSIATLSPGTEFIAPKLEEKYQIDPRIAFTIGLGVDIATPGPGELKKFTKGDDLVNAFRSARGLSANDIMSKHPDLNLKRDITVTDIHGKKSVIPEGEALTPYELKGNKVLLQDGETYIVSKNQFENIKGNSLKAEAQEFAPELKGTEETVRGSLTANQKSVGQKNLQILENRKAEIERMAEKQDLPQNIRDEYVDIGDKIDSLRTGLARTDTTKYSQYQLPGGENYKEVLIKAKGYADELTLDKIAKDNYDKEFRLLNTEQKGVVSDLHDKLNKPYNSAFKSSHWDEPNVISHLRLNERTYNGKKVTFMEELQSDWAREGRSKGFANEAGLRIKALEQEAVEINRKANAGVTDTTRELLDKRLGEIRDEQRSLVGKEVSGVPNNPLLKNWQELSVKRALKDAVDNNSEYFAWTTGEQQAARYNLANQVNDIKWEKFVPENPQQERIVKHIAINLKEGGGGAGNLVGRRDVLDIYLNKNGVIDEQVSTPSKYWNKKLDEALPKNIAEQIVTKDSGKLSGEKDLSIGGEWAKNLYDRQVKSIVEKVTGGKVEMIDMGLPVEGREPIWVMQSGRDVGAKPRPSDLKVGMELNQKGNNVDYIITEVLEEGKFKAVSNNALGRKLIGQNLADDVSSIKKIEFLKRKSPADFQEIERTFDISTKKTQQQGIRLTPEIKAKIKGEAPELKKPSGKEPFIKEGNFQKGSAKTGALIGAGAVSGAYALSETKNDLGEFRGKERPYQPTIIGDLTTVKPLQLGPIKYIPQNVPKDWKDAIEKAYEDTQLPPGLLEAVLMKESDMGKTSKNIAGFGQSAQNELKRLGIPFDLSTDEGKIDAMAKYLKVRADQKGLKTAEDIYLKGYYTKKGLVNDPKIFSYYLNNYKGLYPGRTK